MDRYGKARIPSPKHLYTEPEKRWFLKLVLLCCFSLLCQLVLYPLLPATVPTNWDLYGQVGVQSPRSTHLLLCAFPLFTTLGFYLAPCIDPRRRNYRQHGKAYRMVAAATVGLVLAMSWAATFTALGMQLPIPSIIMVLVGLLYVVLGNHMPQFRPNYFCGIRTPWALANDVVWRKTQRMGGFLFCLCGIVLLLFAFLPSQAAWYFAMPLFLTSVALPALYSYILHRKITQEDSHAKN